MNIFSRKLRDVIFAVLPVTLIVLLLNFTIVPIEGNLIFMFLISALIIVAGLTLFLIGVDLGIAPLGALVGSTIAKKNKLIIVVIAGLILGFFISLAEPALLILSSQIDVITNGAISSISIMVVVSLGMAFMMVLGLLRILYNMPLYIVLFILYGIVLIFSFFTSREFLAISFDASGATTGVLAVPFILSLSIGITSIKKDSKASEKDSFGLVAITSVGAIMAVMILNMFTKNLTFTGTLEKQGGEITSVFMTFINLIPETFRESLLAFSPLVALFAVVMFLSFKSYKRELKRISFGFIYSFAGLFLFIIGINAGFMRVGSLIGSKLTALNNQFIIIMIGLVLGIVTILAEPAVYVLTRQIEEITTGYVKKFSVLTALSIGVGIAVALSMLRIIIPEIQLWHYLLPGYLISLLLTFIVPKLFVGIAFDAGGVATGPMTATFILAFTHGAADAFAGADLMIDGFGMIAMVALMPIITLQILGLVFKIKTRKKVVVENGE